MSLAPVLSLGYVYWLTVRITEAFCLPKPSLFSNYKVILFLCHLRVNWIQIQVVWYLSSCWLVVNNHAMPLHNILRNILLRKRTGVWQVTPSNSWRTLNVWQRQWRIQDFPQGGALTPKIAIIFQIFAKNCMKMKELGPPGGRPWRPPLDPPMKGIKQPPPLDPPMGSVCTESKMVFHNHVWDKTSLSPIPMRPPPLRSSDGFTTGRDYQ